MLARRHTGDTMGYGTDTVAGLAANALARLDLSSQCWWSIALSALGLAGLYLAGRSSYWGWLVSLAGELVWIAYGLRTGQPSFAISAVAYGWVYARNLRAWRQARPEPRHGQKPTAHSARAARPSAGRALPLLLIAVVITWAAYAPAALNSDPITAASPVSGAPNGHGWLHRDSVDGN